MAIAAFVVAVLALVISGLSVAYTRRYTQAAEAEDRRARTPRLSITAEHGAEGATSIIYVVRNDGPQDLDSLVIFRPRPMDGITYPMAKTGMNWVTDEVELGPLGVTQEARFTLSVGAGSPPPRSACGSAAALGATRGNSWKNWKNPVAALASTRTPPSSSRGISCSSIASQGSSVGEGKSVEAKDEPLTAADVERLNIFARTAVSSAHRWLPGPRWPIGWQSRAEREINNREVRLDDSPWGERPVLTAYAVSAMFLIAAGESLTAMAAFLSEATTPLVPGIQARASIEAGSKAAWLKEPSVSPRGRVVRWVLCRAASAYHLVLQPC